MLNKNPGPVSSIINPSSELRDSSLSQNRFEQKISISTFTNLFGFGSVSEAKTALALFSFIPEFPLIAGRSFQVDIDHSVSGNHVLDFFIRGSKGLAFAVEFHPICLEREMKFNDLYKRFTNLTDKYQGKNLGRNGRLITSNDRRLPDITSQLKSLQKDICERYYIQKRANYLQNSESAVVRNATFVLVKGEHELAKFLEHWNPKITKKELESKSWSKRTIDIAELLRANGQKEPFHANYEFDYNQELPVNARQRAVTPFELIVLETIKQTLIGLTLEYGNRFSNSVSSDHRAKDTYINFLPFHGIVVKPHEVSLRRELGQKLLVEDPLVKLGLISKARDVYTGKQILARFERFQSILDPSDFEEFEKIQLELARFTNYKRLRCSFSHSAYSYLPAKNFIHVSNVEELWERVVSPLAGPRITRQYFDQVWNENQENIGSRTSELFVDAVS